MRRLIIVLVATALAAAGTTVATTAETHSARWSGAVLRAGVLLAPADHAPSWHEATLVGGIHRLAAVLGLPGPVDRVQLWRDVARRVHASEMDNDNRTSLDDLRIYVAATGELQRALDNKWPADGLTLAAAVDRLGSSRTHDVLRALGLRLEPGRALGVRRPSDRESSARRRVWTKAGLPIESLEQQLADGRAVSIPLPIEQVPTPLASDVWQSIRGGDPAAPISAASLFTDRRATLLGDGLLTLDAETLAALTADRDTLTELYRRRSGTVAAFGRSLRIRKGRVQVPGGATAEPIWTAIVGAPPTPAAVFVQRLFEKDEGRVAFFYDALAHLDAPHLVFALGGPGDDDAVDARVPRARALATIFASVDLNLEALPFSRPIVSPAVMLLEIAVSGDGQPAFPASRAFWDAAFAEGPVLAGSAVAPASLMAHDRTDAIDAAWLLSRLASGLPAVQRERFHQVLFAQRLFASIDPPQLAHALVAVRGMAAMPALVLTLERLGITEPSLYAEAVRAADAIGDMAHRGRASIAMAQFQGALALIERLCWSRSLGTADAARLLRGLFTIHPTDRRFDGAIARWVDLELIPRLRPAVPVDAADGAERVLMAAIAGAMPETDSGEEQLVVWEGLTYRVDLGARELDRLTGVRERQHSHSLDAVLAFTRAAAALTHGPSSLATLDSLQSAIQAIVQARAGLRSVAIAAPGLPSASAVESAIAKSLTELRNIRQSADLPNAVAAAAPLVSIGDALLAHTLTAFVYATSAGPADGMVLLAGDVSERHDFGLGEGDATVRRRRPWALPTERIDVGRPWHVRGSLLALDVGLGRLRLRRIAEAPRLPRLTVSERHAFTDAAILFNPRAVIDADRSEIVAAIARGRVRVQALALDDDLDRIAAESGLSEWRRQALAWTRQHEPNRTLSLFSLGELLRLGRPEDDLALRLDRWGTATGLSGCLCVRFPPHIPPESYEGRKDSGMVAAMVPDLLLRALELLDRLHLPASLAAGVLESVTQEYVDEVGTAYHDDWLRLVRHAQALTEDRMADHVSALTAVGALVPVGRGDALRRPSATLRLAQGRPEHRRGATERAATVGRGRRNASPLPSSGFRK